MIYILGGGGRVWCLPGVSGGAVCNLFPVLPASRGWWLGVGGSVCSTWWLVLVGGRKAAHMGWLCGHSQGLGLGGLPTVIILNGGLLPPAC